MSESDDPPKASEVKPATPEKHGPSIPAVAGGIFLLVAIGVVVALFLLGVFESPTTRTTVARSVPAAPTGPVLTKNDYYWSTRSMPVVVAGQPAWHDCPDNTVVNVSNVSGCYYMLNGQPVKTLDDNCAKENKPQTTVACRKVYAKRTKVVSGQVWCPIHYSATGTDPSMGTTDGEECVSLVDTVNPNDAFKETKCAKIYGLVSSSVPCTVPYRYKVLTETACADNIRESRPTDTPIKCEQLHPVIPELLERSTCDTYIKNAVAPFPTSVLCQLQQTFRWSTKPLTLAARTCPSNSVSLMDLYECQQKFNIDATWTTKKDDDCTNTTAGPKPADQFTCAKIFAWVRTALSGQVWCQDMAEYATGVNMHACRSRDVVKLQTALTNSTSLTAEDIYTGAIAADTSCIAALRPAPVNCSVKYKFSASSVCTDNRTLPTVTALAASFCTDYGLTPAQALPTTYKWFLRSDYGLPAPTCPGYTDPNAQTTQASICLASDVDGVFKLPAANVAYPAASLCPAAPATMMSCVNQYAYAEPNAALATHSPYAVTGITLNRVCERDSQFRMYPSKPCINTTTNSVQTPVKTVSDVWTDTCVGYGVPYEGVVGVPTKPCKLAYNWLTPPAVVVCDAADVLGTAYATCSDGITSTTSRLVIDITCASGYQPLRTASYAGVYKYYNGTSTVDVPTRACVRFVEWVRMPSNLKCPVYKADEKTPEYVCRIQYLAGEAKTGFDLVDDAQCTHITKPSTSTVTCINKYKWQVDPPEKQRYCEANVARTIDDRKRCKDFLPGDVFLPAGAQASATNCAAYQSPPIAAVPNESTLSLCTLRYKWAWQRTDAGVATRAVVLCPMSVPNGTRYKCTTFAGFGVEEKRCTDYLFAGTFTAPSEGVPCIHPTLASNADRSKSFYTTVSDVYPSEQRANRGYPLATTRSAQTETVSLTAGVTMRTPSSEGLTTQCALDAQWETIQVAGLDDVYVKLGGGVLEPTCFSNVTGNLVNMSECMAVAEMRNALVTTKCPCATGYYGGYCNQTSWTVRPTLPPTAPATTNVNNAWGQLQPSATNKITDALNAGSKFMDVEVVTEVKSNLAIPAPRTCGAGVLPDDTLPTMVCRGVCEGRWTYDLSAVDGDRSLGADPNLCRRPLNWYPTSFYIKSRHVNRFVCQSDNYTGVWTDVPMHWGCLWQLRTGAFGSPTVNILKADTLRYMIAGTWRSGDDFPTVKVQDGGGAMTNQNWYIGIENDLYGDVFAAGDNWSKIDGKAVHFASAVSPHAGAPDRSSFFVYTPDDSGASRSIHMLTEPWVRSTWRGPDFYLYPVVDSPYTTYPSVP